MRVTFVIHALGPGGAERVLSIMANYWAEREWQIVILTLDDGAEPPFYELHRDVVHTALGIAGESTNAIEAARNNVRRIVALSRAIRQSRPEVVISFMTSANVLTLLATIRAGNAYKCRLPVIVSERNDPHTYPIGKTWDIMRRLVYPRAACLVVQTDAARRYYRSRVQRRSRVIPNPVLPQSSCSAGARDSVPPAEVSHQSSPRNAIGGYTTQKTLIAMGRLTDVKGFDLLLHAFARIAVDHPRWSLEIWGEGPLRPALEALARELRLQDRVCLPGMTREPFAKMQEADLFVLSSRTEGFPNVLCEALACGLPSISFGVSGARAIIRDGVDGLLVPPFDVEALAAALDRLMGNEAERRRLSERAPEILRRYGLTRVMAMWEELIEDITEKKP